MNAETLKDFLISLGFKVDEAGARKFDAVVAGTTLKAIELGVKVEAAALSVVAFTAKIASGLDDLYWASQRTGATVEGIKQIGYAVSQVGGSVDGARGSLENLARFMRNNPGAEGFLNRLGFKRVMPAATCGIWRRSLPASASVLAACRITARTSTLRCWVWMKIP